MVHSAIAIHNTGLNLIVLNQTDAGLKLLNDALKLVRSTIDVSHMTENMMSGIQLRYSQALVTLSCVSRDHTGTGSIFSIVDCHDLHRKNLSREIMSSTSFVLVRIDEEIYSLDSLDVICVLVLQNIASAHSCIDTTNDSMQCTRSIELLLLSRSLQMKLMFENDTSLFGIDQNYSSTAKFFGSDSLQLMMITLWRLKEMCKDDGMVLQVHNELLFVQQQFLYVFSRYEMIFYHSRICAPCA
jgi:hypothetical protein